MGAAAKRSLYLTTADGVFRAVPEGETYALTSLGFKGQGTFRAPVLVDKDDVRTLYAGTTRSGMHKSADGGESWREIDNGLAYKEIWSIVQHPKTGALYVGTCPTDVFISDDRGESWQEAAQLQRLPTTKGWTGPVPPHVSRLKSIALHAERPGLVYGAIEEGWSIRSTDGGRTWEQLDQGTDHDGHSIAIMPREPQVIVSSGGKGVFRSEDGGSTFVESGQGIGDRRRYTPAPLVQHPSRPDTLVTAVACGPVARPEGGTTAFIRSDDQGRTWQISSQGLPPEPYVAVPRSLAVDPEDPSRFFAGLTDGTVWTSGDGAESWTQVMAGLPAVMGITVSPN
jgi:photosystem II stability/assembly factor-like uncharacterized protein